MPGDGQPDAAAVKRKAELAAAEARFRARQRERAASVADHADIRAIRVRQRRMLFWSAVAGVSLALVAYVQTLSHKPLPPVLPMAPPRKAAAMLGEAGRPPAGCREVQGYQESGIGLAPGAQLAVRTQIENAQAWGLPLEIENSIGMRFRLIPPGSFVMGSKLTEPGRGPDEPEHVESVRDPFYLGVYEVTQTQWNKVMGAATNPSLFTRNAENRPVEEVTWDDTRKFLEALSRLDGVDPKAYRLPLESEWEYACRAGTQALFYTGDTREDLMRAANFADNNERGTAEVGLRQANAWGLYDMHGNVWEWCENIFQEYTGKKKADVFRRVIRGGNWKLPWLDCRSASRYRLTTTSHANLLGFRVVRMLLPGELHPPAEAVAVPADSGPAEDVPPLPANPAVDDGKPTDPPVQDGK